MSELKDDVAITPGFEDREAFFAVGCAGEFRPGATQDIGRLWSHFVPRMHEVAGRVGEATYGICCPSGEASEKDPERFTYVAAVETKSLEAIPADMVGVEVPARHYAVFAYDGGLGPNLPKTMQYIFGEWLPESGYVLDGYDFEYYDDDFDPQTNVGTFYIYVPIKRSE